MEYAFHLELNISVLGEQAQWLKLLSQVILGISGEMSSLYLTKNQKNPLNATMRKSYTPVENWDTEILYDFRNDAGYQPAESEWKTQPPHPGTQINQTWILQSKEYCLEGWLCGTAKAGPALESREQRMKGKELNSMKLVLPTQDGRGKEAIFSPKLCS